MKKTSILRFYLGFYVSFPLILLYSCSKNEASTQESQNILYSQSFSIKDLGQGKKLITDSKNRTFLLVPKIVQKKSSQDSSKTNKINPIDRIIVEYPEIEGVFQTPLDRILLGSTTQASFLKALGALDRVIAVPLSKKSWTIPEIRQGLQKKDLYSIGDPYLPDLERIRVLKPSLAFVYAGHGVQLELMQALDRFQIPYIVANTHMEKTLLETLSWILFFSVFFQKESKAHEFFQDAQETIRSIQKKKPKNSPTKKSLSGQPPIKDCFILHPKPAIFIISFKLLEELFPSRKQNGYINLPQKNSISTQETQKLLFYLPIYPKIFDNSLKNPTS